MSELALKLIREAKEKRATSLDLGRCGLSELPEELFELEWLEELVLGNENSRNNGPNNLLTRLPSKLSLLGSLKKLNIGGGYPGETFPISDLRPLQALIQLQELYLSYTQVQDLNPLQALTGLQTLYLSDTQVQDLSPLQALTGLQTLDLSGTQVQDLSPLKALNQLQELDLSGTQVQDLSPLKALNQLQELYLSDTQIQDWSPLKALNQLQGLYLSDTQVQDLSPLQGLKQLQGLYLSDTQIQDLSPLQGLKQLQVLDFSDTQISDLSLLHDFKQLQRLYLMNTKVTDLSALRDLKQLLELYLSRTQVCDLSPLHDLKQLQQLYMSSTQVCDLSPIKALKNLFVLSASDCPIPYIPKEITQQRNCAPDLKAYWKDLDHSQAETNNQLKIMFLGNGCVGKTTLLHWFIDNSFKDLSLESARTHGIIIQPWMFPDSPMLANFWDFGGQEVYHATHRLFLGRRTLYLLVWATETPEQAGEERHPPQYWLDMIADIASPQERSRVIIVQNRFEGQPVQNMLSNEELEAYTARGLDIAPMSVNAKSGENIKTFKTQVEEAAAQLLATYVEELPSTWVNIRRVVAERRAGGDKTMPWSDFVEICKTSGLPSDPAVVLGYLHRAGEVFHYPNQFDNQLILDQQWALKAVYAILKKDRIERYKGIFQLEDLLEIWRSGHPDLSAEEAKVFLNFMLGNQILFHTEKEGGRGSENPEFVLPQLLPLEKPPLWKLWEDIPDVLAHRIRYAFLHRDIIERFMVQTAYLSKEKAWWRQGLFIEFEGNKAVIEVQEAEASKFIQIRCTGATREKLLQTIREEFHQIRPLEKAQEYQLLQGEWKPWSATIRMAPDEKSGFPAREARLDKMEAILEKISLFVEKNNANMETVPLKTHLKKLVAQAKHREAVDKLLHWTENNDNALYNEVIAVAARLTSLETETQASRLSAENAKVFMAQITGSINYLIDQVPDGVTIQVAAPVPIPPTQVPETTPPPIPAAKVEILMLTANPAGTTELKLKEEHSIITTELQENRDRFNLIHKQAVDRAGFQRFIEFNKPNILHFSGHGEPGGADGGIKVQNEHNNGYELIPPSGLDALFEYFKEENIAINTVVLNACYSEEQAQAIATHVPYVIGTTVALPDKQARAFSVGFYFKLVTESTLNIEKAFRSGRTQAAAAGAAKSDFVIYKNNQKLEI